MKVVLLCGRVGTRLRNYGRGVAEPLVPIGYRSILWHVMRDSAYMGR